MSQLARREVNLWIQWLCATFLLEACWHSLTRAAVSPSSMPWWRRILDAVCFLLPPVVAKEIVDMRCEAWWAGTAVFVAVLVPEMLLSAVAFPWSGPATEGTETTD